MMINNIIIRELDTQPYMQTYQAMHDFTLNRNEQTPDEIWLVEHYPIFTQGKVGKPEHLLHQSDIPVVATDRGGQITYHAPGQQIMYILFDLKRRKIGIRDIVHCLEKSVIQTLAHYAIMSYAKAEAPGVYINHKKICSLGLHIKRGCTLHGLALNIDMDLAPFKNINPCGYAGLQMTQLKEFVPQINRSELKHLLTNNFINLLTN
ncbi:lipoyl(octanoyl) transferase LipB [Gilliamella sp. B2776]|uniref:lipoyl(octanoyl) transferase LipB n=1 Tax=unclassified Gilliamella TaxID=2685620 RepID=UPI00226A8CA7|nr:MULTISPECIES: lipoyl(octanoyl) transferase LipB [unclassified Gilliamella]MCX8650682.1 lipoyl(octanoyl) transferase LipB [Gilliamella sp. B2779]MCX8654299.1 lipoyl(octanoyl) transferase LipB [Gilliamella sp. B2737]MCX8657056.1 lipoyl(octanoyl) transferase LipB [Gilliamella sp. B2894]MCX8665779.1 lipoyl(octanoyl) transferase LipB [Gilliamella sp. B2887]MCX8692530.1 lipoyl(octanoyl) transferase LipB [Gilliamella sp. B2776]